MEVELLPKNSTILAEPSRNISGLTYEEEMSERIRRKNCGLLIKTFHEYDSGHWKSQNEVRSYFSSFFGEYLLWDHGVRRGSNLIHYWLPRTKEQAMLLKLRFG